MRSVETLKEEVKEKDEKASLLEIELSIAKATIEEKKVDALALKKVKRLLDDESVGEKVDFISQEISSLSNILQNIKELSK